MSNVFCNRGNVQRGLRIRVPFAELLLIIVIVIVGYGVSVANDIYQMHEAERVDAQWAVDNPRMVN